MMMRINQIWTELENDTSLSTGLLLRRYSGTMLPDVFVALKVPEQFRCIAVNISSSIQINLTGFSNLKDISIELLTAEQHLKKTVVIKLINSRHKDIFSVLCEDLITSVSDVSDENILIKVLLNRFEKWKSLFDKASSQGLSPEEQRGLFGELFLLRKIIRKEKDKLKAVNTWVGCAGEIRDFQSGNWAIEVKTTHGNNHQRVQVSNERQLDIHNLDFLYLFHLSLDTLHKSGETLNQVVESVKMLLSEETIAFNRYLSKLIEGGYFDIHRELYDENGYFIRQESFYLIENEFPRIEENDLRNGVGDVSYSIILSQCTDYLKQEESVFENIAIE